MHAFQSQLLGSHSLSLLHFSLSSTIYLSGVQTLSELGDQVCVFRLKWEEHLAVRKWGWIGGDGLQKKMRSWPSTFKLMGKVLGGLCPRMLVRFSTLLITFHYIKLIFVYVSFKKQMRWVLYFLFMVLKGYLGVGKAADWDGLTTWDLTWREATYLLKKKKSSLNCTLLWAIG